MDLAGLTPDQQHRLGNMLRWYETYGASLTGQLTRPSQQAGFIPTFIGKVTSASTGSGSGTFEHWSSTAASTTAEVATGSSEGFYDWFGAGASTNDKLLIWRHARSGRLYGTAMTNAVLGKLDGAMAAGATVTVSVWKSTGGAEADTGVNITARDWLLQSTESVASGKKVVCQFISERWYVVGGECSS